MLLVNYVDLDDGTRYVYTIEETEYDLIQQTKKREVYHEYNHYFISARSKKDELFQYTLL